MLSLFSPFSENPKKKQSHMTNDTLLFIYFHAKSPWVISYQCVVKIQKKLLQQYLHKILFVFRDFAKWKLKIS